MEVEFTLRLVLVLENCSNKFLTSFDMCHVLSSIVVINSIVDDRLRLNNHRSANPLRKQMQCKK
jgi:hypothetical protein